MKHYFVTAALAALVLAGPAGAQNRVPSVPRAATPTPTATATPRAAARPRTTAAPVAQPTRPPQVPRTVPATPRAGAAPATPRSALPPSATPALPRGGGLPVPAPGEELPAPVRPTPREMRNPQPTMPKEMRPAKPVPPAEEMPIPIGVRLERIRITRSKTFTAPTRAPQTGFNEESMWESEMALQLHLTSSREWEVLKVLEANVRQVLDQGGQPLTSVKTIGALDPTSPATDLNPMEPPFRRVDDGAVLLLRATPPPANVRAFRQFDARITATLGQRSLMKVEDLRAKIGASLAATLRESGMAEVALQVSDVEEDAIHVIAIGELDRIGSFTFTDASGKELRPYNFETEVRDVPKAAKAQSKESKEWHFFFRTLPPKINMTVTVYPNLVTRNWTISFKDVTLP